MAPRETPKATPKVQRKVVKSSATNVKPTDSTVKKTMSAKKAVQKIPFQVSNVTMELRRRTSTVPNVATPKAKGSNSDQLPASVTKSAKKPTWKRRPKPAHSGVPVPEKMKRIEKQLREMKSSLLNVH